MSENEEKEKIKVLPEDCKSCIDFFDHFKIPMPDTLRNAIGAFQMNPNQETLKDLRFYTCDAIVNVDHPAFRDPLFAKVYQACEKILYSMSFDRNAENFLSSQKESKDT